VYGRRDVAIRGALLAGGFRTQRELNSMSLEDQRNTLIVTLEGFSNRSGAYYQTFDDERLGGAGAVLVYLREARVRTDDELKRMSDEDQRNTVIVLVAAQTNLSIQQLQARSSLKLVGLALGSQNSSYIWGVLLAGHYRSLDGLETMSATDRRNTLIVELEKRTNQSGSHYQTLNDENLAGVGAAALTLLRGKVRMDADIKRMSDEDIRNTLIVELDQQTGYGSRLQGLTTMSLVGLAFGIYP
jgi:hypothetical protein